jgi:hypothetical protein
MMLTLSDCMQTSMNSTSEPAKTHDPESADSMLRE